MIPGLINQGLDISWLSGYLDALWAMVVFPLIIWSLMGSGVMALGKAANLGNAWRSIALPVAIIISAGHMSKGLAKFVSWVGFLPYALKEPSGIQTAMNISQGIFPKPHELLSLPTVAFVASILIGLSVFLAVRVTPTKKAIPSLEPGEARR